MGLNFLEAVKELAGGECKAIKHRGWINRSFVINKAHSLWDAYDNCPAFAGMPFMTYLDDDWEPVVPCPVLEEVEVKRWGVLEAGMIYDSEEEARTFHANQPIIALVGHYSRPAKRKVKKRLDCSDFWAYIREETDLASGISDTAKLFAEWEEEE